MLIVQIRRLCRGGGSPAATRPSEFLDPLDKDPCAAPDCADGIRETQRIIYAIVVAKDVAHERGTARRPTAGYVTQGNK